MDHDNKQTICLVCNRLICTRLVCNRLVCNRLVCNRLVCNRLLVILLTCCNTLIIVRNVRFLYLFVGTLLSLSRGCNPYGTSDFCYDGTDRVSGMPVVLCYVVCDRDGCNGAQHRLSYNLVLVVMATVVGVYGCYGTS